jgi:hypothetical protein
MPGSKGGNPESVWYGEVSPHCVAMLRVVDLLLERTVRRKSLFGKCWRSS